jgi:CheY-like chemotaxis protein
MTRFLRHPGRPRIAGIHDLMRFRIMDVLLVATPYDRFILEEAGELSERMLGEFRNLDLQYIPGMTGFSSGAEALELAARQRTFNLIITTPQVKDMDAAELAQRAREQGLDAAVVVLAWDAQELSTFTEQTDTSYIDRLFLWQGDARILVAIVKSVEDWRNVATATSQGGVQVVIVIEDNVRYYSSFLPVIYSELLRHSQRVIAEGLNLLQKVVRMRARPKILLCTTFEEAQAAFESYRDNVMGIIADVEFPRDGRKDPQAGVEFAKLVKESYLDIPLILHSTRPENEKLAQSIGANFLLKQSALMLQDLRRVMLHDFAFGDFVFRMPDGTEVDRAGDLRTMEQKLRSAPAESIAYHGSHNHFSRWLKARTEFHLAEKLRPRQPSEFPSTDALRATLIESINEYRREQQQHVVADFDRDKFDFSTDFYRIGGGSLGGKARGLAFVRRLLCDTEMRHRFDGVEIKVPPTFVLGTDVFDEFLETNDLRAFAVECEDDAEIAHRFRNAIFPDAAARDVATLLESIASPLAVRSSSLLEDSQHQPFTGVYATMMLRNNAWSVAERLEHAIRAIKMVYASAFSQQAKSYLPATPYRLEEEKMAVMLQQLVGSSRGGRFYPNFAGVVRSHNFYPAPPMTAQDGIAAVALGLGCAVVQAGSCLRFSPRYPQHILEFASTVDMLESTQRGFFALPLSGDVPPDGEMEIEFGLDVAERDGALAPVASTYSSDNDTVYDGLSRPGPRIVSFAPILKHGLFPLPDVLSALTEMGREGMGSDVEIEFAVNLDVPRGAPREFGFLQMRPLSLLRESEALTMDAAERRSAFCWSSSVLGNGRIEDVRDLVVVDFKRFERSRSLESAAEVGRLNAQLVRNRTPYILIGVGRWGSRDPWLGIPVAWSQVAGARVIVEAGLRDLRVTPSQGTHFFQNLTSFNVGYFTVNPDSDEGFVDWAWLDAQRSLSDRAHVRHIRLDSPILVKMSGKTGEGVILKPGD